MASTKGATRSLRSLTGGWRKVETSGPFSLVSVNASVLGKAIWPAGKPVLLIIKGSLPELVKEDNCHKPANLGSPGT